MKEIIANTYTGKQLVFSSQKECTEHFKITQIKLRQSIDQNMPVYDKTTNELWYFDELVGGKNE